MDDLYQVLCANCAYIHPDTYAFDTWRDHIKACEECGATEGDYGIGSVPVYSP